MTLESTMKTASEIAWEIVNDSKSMQYDSERNQRLADLISAAIVAERSRVEIPLHATSIEKAVGSDTHTFAAYDLDSVAARVIAEHQLLGDVRLTFRVPVLGEE